MKEQGNIILIKKEDKERITLNKAENWQPKIAGNMIRKKMEKYWRKVWEHDLFIVVLGQANGKDFVTYLGSGVGLGLMGLEGSPHIWPNGSL